MLLCSNTPEEEIQEDKTTNFMDKTLRHTWMDEVVLCDSIEAVYGKQYHFFIWQLITKNLK